ncbi:MAG: 30S ribosomal protein S7 [Dehalococcoidia bacterium]|jgi:small subunit ribosomal protein S7|nr:30S ribosomal protein S7 [Dehalococcoidia bacterium]
MPRRAKRVQKRIIVPDAKYGSVDVSKFVNRIMLKGKKSTAERIVYGAMELAAEQASTEAVELLAKAIDGATPLIRVKPRRVGGATYQVPMEVDKKIGRALAMRWIIIAARARSGKSMQEKLAAELVDAVQGRGAAVRKREEIHRMADANRAFVHYRW